MAALVTVDELEESVVSQAGDTPARLQRWLLVAQGAIEDVIGPVATHAMLGDPIFDATVHEVHLSVAVRLRDQWRGAEVADYETDEPLTPGSYPALSPRDQALLKPYAKPDTTSTPQFSFPPTTSWVC